MGSDCSPSLFFDMHLINLNLNINLCGNWASTYPTSAVLDMCVRYMMLSTALLYPAGMPNQVQERRAERAGRLQRRLLAFQLHQGLPVLVHAWSCTAFSPATLELVFFKPNNLVHFNSAVFHQKQRSLLIV
jgi:hypothetical protein